MAHIHVVAELVAKPERADDLRRMFSEFAASSAKEPGCLEYTLMEDAERPGRFFTHERWEDQASIDTHMQTDTIQALIPKLGDILAQPFTITPCAKVG